MHHHPVEIFICYAICILLTIIDVLCLPLGSPYSDIAWFLAVGALLVLPLIAVRRIHPRDEVEAGIVIQFTKKDILFGLVVVLLLIVPVFFGHYALQIATHGQDYVPDISNLSHLERPIWYEFLLQIFCVALPEEFFYRGYVQTELTHYFKSKQKIQKYAVVLAIVLTSLMFAASHLPSGNITRLATFFPGLLFGFIRFKTNGLVGAILCHASCNMMMVIYNGLYI